MFDHRLRACCWPAHRKRTPQPDCGVAPDLPRGAGPDRPGRLRPDRRAVPTVATLYFDVVTSKTTVAGFLSLAGFRFPLVDFDLADLMTTFPPAAVSARTS